STCSATTSSCSPATTRTGTGSGRTAPSTCAPAPTSAKTPARKSAGSTRSVSTASTERRSAPPPFRWSPFGKRTRAFFSILGRENAVAVKGFVGIGRVQVKRQALDSRLFGRRHGKRRVDRDALGVLIGGVHQLIVRHHLIDQPHRERAVGVDHARGQQQLHRQRVGQLARQPHGTAAAGKQSALRFHYSESRLRHGDANIGGGQHLESACHTDTVDGGDDRLVDRKLVQDSVNGVAFV